MAKRATLTKMPQAAASPRSEERERIFELYRRWGYLEADLDPLGHFQPQQHPELPRQGAFAEEARRCYCGTLAVEFSHIADPERRRWLAERMEQPAKSSAEDREFLLERLARAELFEQIMQKRYLGTKRYSLEGTAAVIPLLDFMLEEAHGKGAEEAVLAMSHRGRLNVILNIVQRPGAEIFAGFEDIDPKSVMGSGDVKYHLGAVGHCKTRGGGQVRVHLVSNPSHLEAVDPVAMGRARAKQRHMGRDGHLKTVPIILHGDAAFAGQGVWAETLNFSGLHGFSVCGAVHVIVNNLIGFTTTPRESHASRFASDLAKRLPIPVFHVNGEDPEAVARVARMAMEYRYRFGSDVVVDLIGYRRHGHSEVDDPTITQPLLYARIKDHPTAYERFARQIGADTAPLEEKIRAELDEAQKQAAGFEKKPALFKLPSYWDKYFGGSYKPEYEVDTGIATEQVREICEGLGRYPQDFHIHPKLVKLLEQRAEMGRGERPFDFGTAEAVAFGSVLLDGLAVRLSGQDSRRGTFNQRHAVLIDTENEQEWVPLSHLREGQARFEVYNSILSEAAVLGFEYGYSRDYPDGLVLWEAQFGDFANNAQGVIDQFISAGEDKWGLLSGVVLLLPHGYEGQGPEHSSARMERFLQLAAEDNIQVCQPSNSAQYFHLLRRQALRKWRKPLVVFTPKSMLRHPAAGSQLEEFTRARFLNVIPDPEISDAERVLLCSGKIGHELRQERKRRTDETTAIVFLEQLYPWPERELEAALAEYPSAREVVWVQEEPGNMGALFYVRPKLRRLLGGRVRTIQRSASASPATGSGKAHEMEQKTLLTLAFSTGK